MLFIDVVFVVAFQAAMLEMNQENEGIKPAVSFPEYQLIYDRRVTQRKRFS